MVDQLFGGKIQLATALQPLVVAAEDVLGLDDARRAATLIRVDAGEAVWTIATGCSRGYKVLAAELALSYVYAYDARGGALETSFKGDNQGLGLTKRSKKRFCAQQLTTLLGSLAHNVIVWARGWLVEQQPELAHYGMLRMVRDVFHIQARVELDAKGHVVQIVLNQTAPLVRGIGTALQMLLAPTHTAISLGELRYLEKIPASLVREKHEFIAL